MSKAKATPQKTHSLPIELASVLVQIEEMRLANQKLDLLIEKVKSLPNLDKS